MYLIINAGSATLKLKIFDAKFDEVLNGIVERIGGEDSFLTYQAKAGKKMQVDYPDGVSNHEEALDLAIEQMGIKNYILCAIGHRVVHGGEEFVKPTVITAEVLKKLEKYNQLAPLHNPVNIACIKAAQKLLPGVENIAVFDTAFFHNLPDYAYRYALPQELYSQNKIRRYGFQGISHQYVAGEAIKKLKNKKAKIIVCHLGSGCSLSAIKNGQAIDTTMGFTPLEGLIMNTRSGDLDPAIPLYLIKELKMSADEVGELLNKQSGLLGISGRSDMREILLAAGYKVPGCTSKQQFTAEEKERAKLALAMFVYRLQKYIGAYAVALGGLDALVFTAGIGERNKTIRKLVVQGLKVLGKFKVLVIPTNEELMIARLIDDLC